MGAGAEPVDAAGLLTESEISVGPWTIAASGAAGGVADAVTASLARKLLIPVEQAGWEWAGVQDASRRKLVGQAAHAARQMVAGEKGSQGWPLSGGAIAAIAFVLLVFLAACLLLRGPIGLFPFGD